MTRLQFLQQKSSCGRTIRLGRDESPQYRLTIFFSSDTKAIPAYYQRGVTVISVTFYDNRLALRDENMLRQDVIVATTVTSLGREIY